MDEYKKKRLTAVAKMEAGDPSVSLDLLMRALLLLGASREDLTSMIEPQQRATGT